MLLKTIDRTALTAWCPVQQHAYIATGTAAGALDASFSNSSSLDIYRLESLSQPQLVTSTTEPQEFSFSNPPTAASSCTPLVSVASPSRFGRLLWSLPLKDRNQGILAGGLENGELILWDAESVLANNTQENPEAAIVFRSSSHTGTVAGMDFNNQQKHVLATGASQGEIFIWDLETPTKPYSPGPRSTKLEDITSLAWNNQVTHILASASTTGSTVIWDLKNRREVMHLHYGGGAQLAGYPGMATTRRGVTAVAWNPDNATQLVTASEDDSNPVVMMWDLRNAQAPERILSGHTKGVLSLSWCKKDADLLFSSGKDNRTICWNPSRGEMVGELAPSDNWVFDVQFNQHNPNLFSTSSFDGKVNVHSLQSTNEGEDVSRAAVNASQDDPFSAAIYSASAAASFSLKQPPKWYRRPVGASFGFGNQLVHFAPPSAATLASAANTGATVPHAVAVSSVVTDKSLLQRSQELEHALESNSINEFCEHRIRAADSELEAKNWQVLKLLFENDARDRLVRFLGFSKEELKDVVGAKLARQGGQVTKAEAVLPSVTSPVAASLNQSVEDMTLQDDDAPKEADARDPFADENAEASTAAPTEGAEFFAQAAAAGPAVTDQSTVGPTFLHQPLTLGLEADDLNALITRTILMGDFDDAVDVCLKHERYADALILASCGGADLLARTQQLYFEAKGDNLPYIRLLHGIVGGDLSDVVESSNIQEWDKVLVLLCTYAQGDQFSNLCEKLGERLESTWQTQSPGNTNSQLLQSAVVCYLAAGSLDRVVRIWIYLQKMGLDVNVQQGKIQSADNPSVQATALQHLVEKVSVFRKAVDFIDTAVETPLGSAVPTHADKPLTEATPRNFTLGVLYDLYCDYAQWLLTQGQTTIAAKYLKRTPDDYIRTRDDGENLLAILKDRLYHSGTLSGESMLAPSFPFEFVYVGGDGELQTQDYGLDAAAQQAPAPPAPGYPPVPADAGYPAMGYPRTSAVTTAAAPAPTSYQQAGYSGYGYSDYNATAYPSQANTVYPPPAAPYAGYGEAYSTAAAPPTPNTAYPYGQQVEPSVAPVPNPIQNAQATAPNVPPPSQQRSVPAYHDPPTTALNRKRNPSATKTGNNPIMAPFPSAAPIQNVQHTPAGPPPPTSQSRLTSPPPPPPPTGARPPQRAYRTSISKPTVPSPTRTAPPPTAPYQQHAPPPTAAYPPPSGHARPPPQGAHPHYPTGGHPVRPTPPSSSQMPAHPTPSTHAPYQRPPPGHAVRPGGGAPPMGYPSAHPPRPVGPSQQPPNAPRPPMSYGRPPTAGGVPSRAGTPQNVPVPRGPSAASSRPGTPAAAPGKYPPGDRSHIPEKQNPIFTSLQAGLQQARAATGPAQKRMMDDTEKRLNQLFDLMNNGDLPAKLEEPLLSLARAIQNGDYQQAHQVYLKLIHSNFDSSQRWMMGVKRLVETLKSIA